MQFLDTALVNFDEWMIGLFVKNWRDQVWSQAIKLIVNDDQKSNEILNSKVEARALHLASWIIRKPFTNPQDDSERLRLSS